MNEKYHYIGKRVFKAIFNRISVISCLFIGLENFSTLGKRPTFHKSLTNFTIWSYIEYSEKTTDLPQVTDFLFYLIIYELRVVSSTSCHGQ